MQRSLDQVKDAEIIGSRKRYRDHWIKEKMQRLLVQGKDIEIIGSRKRYRDHWIKEKMQRSLVILTVVQGKAIKFIGDFNASSRTRCRDK